VLINLPLALHAAIEAFTRLPHASELHEIIKLFATHGSLGQLFDDDLIETDPA
jgi:hypothetical protein